MDNNISNQQTTANTQVRRSAAMGIMCIIGAILPPVLILSGVGGVFNYALLMFSSGIYAMMIASSPAKAVRLLPMFTAAVAAVVKCVLSPQTAVNTLVLLVGYILCAAIAAFSVVKVNSKTDTLIYTTVGVVATQVLSVVCAFATVYGKFSPTLVKEKISEFFSLLHLSVMQTYENAVNSEVFTRALSQLQGTKEMTAEEFLKIANESVTLIIEGFKAILPALVIIACVFIANLVILGFTISYGAVSKKGFFGGKYFEYNVSGFTGRVFNVVFFISILGSFIGLPKMVLLVCANILLILLFPMIHIALRSIYRYFLSKGKNPAAVVFVMTAVVLLLVFVTSGFALLMLALLGAMQAKAN